MREKAPLIQWIAGLFVSAETVGFEPTEECKPLSTLAGWCTRPNYATSPLFVSNHIGNR